MNTETTVANRATNEAERFIELAEKAAKQRLSVPATEVSVHNIDIPSKRILKRIMDGRFGGQDKKDGRHGLFIKGTTASIRKYAHMGYRPEVEDGDYVRNDTDILVTCPTELYDRQLAQVRAMSDAKIKASTKKATDENGNVLKTVADHKGSATRVGIETTRGPGRPPKVKA